MKEQDLHNLPARGCGGQAPGREGSPLHAGEGAPGGLGIPSQLRAVDSAGPGPPCEEGSPRAGHPLGKQRGKHPSPGPAEPRLWPRPVFLWGLLLPVAAQAGVPRGSGGVPTARAGWRGRAAPAPYSFQKLLGWPPPGWGTRALGPWTLGWRLERGRGACLLWSPGPARLTWGGAWVEGLFPSPSPIFSNPDPRLRPWPRGCSLQRVEEGASGVRAAGAGVRWG